MLQLRAQYELDNSLASKYKYIDKNLIGNRASLHNRSYIRDTYIESALLPVIYNDYEFTQKSYVISDELNSDIDLTNELKRLTEESINKNITYTRIFISIDNLNYDNNLLDSDMFVPVSDTIQSLYTKCLTQIMAREEDKYSDLDNLHLCMYKSKVGNHIVSIQNFNDYVQASDIFLTIGLLPVFFPDFKETLNEEELEYFKGLVTRSQIKRISNVAVTELFEKAVQTKKYTDKLNDILFKKVLANLAENRLRNVRRRIDENMRTAEVAMQQYQNALLTLDELHLRMRALEDGADEFKEEVIAVKNMDSIESIQIDSSYIILNISTTFKYFEADEAEIVINRMDDGFMKWLFIKLFIDQSIKLHIVGSLRYALDNSRSDVYLYTRPAWSLFVKEQAYYNPHLEHYACFGDYKPKLIKAQVDGDLLLFANIGLASIRSLNFKDGTVLSRFRSDLNSILNGNNFTELKIFEDEQGNRLTIRQLHDAWEELENEETTD